MTPKEMRDRYAARLLQQGREEVMRLGVPGLTTQEVLILAFQRLGMRAWDHGFQVGESTRQSAMFGAGEGK